MTTVFVFANKILTGTEAENAAIIEQLSDVLSPYDVSHAVVFPIDHANEDMSEFYADIEAHAAEHGEAHVFFLHVNTVQLRLVNEMLALPSQIIMH